MLKFINCIDVGGSQMGCKFSDLEGEKDGV